MLLQRASQTSGVRTCCDSISQATFAHIYHTQRGMQTAGSLPRALCHARRKPGRSLISRPPSQPLSQASSPSLSDQLRSLMRRISHSVVVCTAFLPGPDGGIPRAMTMSSFTSLALTPRPLVTFNIKAPSSTLDAVVASRVFNIHVLTGDSQGAEIAEWFTKGNFQTGLFEDAGRAWSCTLRNGEPPVLAGKGILSTVRCSLLSDGEGHDAGVVRISDHVIILGEVREVVAAGSLAEYALTYADSKYRTEGDIVQKHTEPDNKS
ncbi:hypothetical protein BROUX41_003226 [Berkeleyomyces rouxiae]|uniref:uncharacterized protein n=1 Tax=Berkeleyomyces rouxiae TaxID=2035830 RepID=UPI003B7EAEE8